MIAENMKNKVFLIVKLLSIKNFPNESVQGLLSPLLFPQRSTTGVPNSILLTGQIFFFACSSAKTDMLLHIKCCFYERNKLDRQDFGLQEPDLKDFE